MDFALALAGTRNSVGRLHANEGIPAPRTVIIHGVTKAQVASLHLLLYMYVIRYRMANNPHPHKIPLIFFRTGTGSEPVREWLKGKEDLALARKHQEELGQ